MTNDKELIEKIKKAANKQGVEPDLYYHCKDSTDTKTSEMNEKEKALISENEFYEQQVAMYKSRELRAVSKLAKQKKQIKEIETARDLHWKTSQENSEKWHIAEGKLKREKEENTRLKEEIRGSLAKQEHESLYSIIEEIEQLLNNPE